MKQDHSTDEIYMRRVFQLALMGKGLVSPNPMVGSVIVKDNRIIGEGWHRQYGGPHAEVNAVKSVTDKKQLAESTVYVNLEPCSHFGKTPPCADLLIQHKVGRVVISNIDTNPLVAGGGIRKLREAGIEVITGILAKEGRELNKRFFTFMEKQRPYIILKWAETSDGYVARENYDSKWISNSYSRQRVHQWRSEEDSILVGPRTAAYDNPSLNVRDWTGRDPVRIVLDRFLKLSDKLHLFDAKQKTLCYNVLKHEEQENLTLLRVDETNFIENVIIDLWKKRVQSVIIEGGATTLSHFIETGMWDEARIFRCKRAFGKGIAAPLLRGRLVHREDIHGDALEYYRPTETEKDHHEL
jgi:diaminohydroxyphosphoribosylaminopyrimidine deaminase / 5-amino-6-(5-phosphoribosylamino)uracil reductase